MKKQWKKKFITGTVIASFCLSVTHFPAVSAAAGEAVTENTYLIITAEAGEDAVLDALAEESVIAEEENVITASLTKTEAASVAGMDETLYVEEDLEVVACGTEDTEDALQESEWNIRMIEADVQEDAASVTGTVKVAVIDSGVNYSDDINVAERKNFVEGDGRVSVLYEDGSGHGTAVAGIIGARDNDMGITGVCPDVEIYSARVLDDQNRASVSRVIAAVNWAMEKDVDITNLSLGCKEDSPALHHVLEQAAKEGILLVGAAGNGGNIMYPAAYNEVMAVGAVGADGLHSENSSVGDEMELVAPGEQILSTGMFDGVMTCGGSSMAAAHATGVAAALWGRDKSVTAGFIRTLMDASAKVYDDTELYGYGLVDMENALANYESVKDSYVESADVEEVKELAGTEENTEAVETFDDVEYVEGLWGTNQHYDLTEHGMYNTEELNIIKAGAVANDVYIQGMTDHPHWHGYYKSTDDNKANYIASYIFLTQLARNVAYGSFEQTAVSGMNGNDYACMANVVTGNGVNGAPWYYCLNGHAVNIYSEKLFIYGMALHVATDTFAHSAYDSSGTRISHKDYYYDKGNYWMDGAAHDTTIYPNRYTCANEIALNVLYRCKNNTMGTVSDFHLSGYKGNFHLRNIRKFVRELDSSYYTTYQSYFDNMNYPIQE